MFGLRSNQSDKSMMFGSNKLERGIIFVTVYYYWKYYFDALFVGSFKFIFV